MIAWHELSKVEIGSLFVIFKTSEKVINDLASKGIDFANKGLVAFNDGIARHLVFKTISDLRTAREIDDKYNK